MRLTAKLAAIVLGLDAFVVVFAALAAFGLRRLDPAAAFGGAAAFIVVCLVGAGLVRRALPAALAIGWLAQVALIACGLLLTPMYFVGGGSLLLWVWCLWRGARADRPAPLPRARGDAR